MLILRRFLASVGCAVLCGAMHTGMARATVILTLAPAQGVDLSHLQVGASYDLTVSALSDQSGEYFVAANGALIPDQNFVFGAGFSTLIRTDPQSSNPLTSDPVVFDFTLIPNVTGTEVIYYDTSYFASGGPAYFETNLADYYLNSNDLIFTAVPEPSAVALFMAGLVMVVRRRTQC